jgi:hypothetical protein
MKTLWLQRLKLFERIRRSGGQVFDLFFERGKSGSQSGFLFVWLR